MTTSALDCVLAGQLRRTAGEINTWCIKAKVLLAGDVLDEVKVRMTSQSFEVLFPAGTALTERVAFLAFQSVQSEDEGSICVAIGVYVYYLALVGRIRPEEFDGMFSDVWTMYFDSVDEWMASGVEAVEGALI